MELHSETVGAVANQAQMFPMGIQSTYNQVLGEIALVESLLLNNADVGDHTAAQEVLGRWDYEAMRELLTLVAWIKQAMSRCQRRGVAPHPAPPLTPKFAPSSQCSCGGVA